MVKKDTKVTIIFKYSVFLLKSALQYMYFLKIISSVIQSSLFNYALDKQKMYTEHI